MLAVNCAIFFILHSKMCVYLVNIPETVHYVMYALAVSYMNCAGAVSQEVFGEAISDGG